MLCGVQRAGLQTDLLRLCRFVRDKAWTENLAVNLCLTSACTCAGRQHLGCHFVCTMRTVSIPIATMHSCELAQWKLPGLPILRPARIEIEIDARLHALRLDYCLDLDSLFCSCIRTSVVHWL